MESFFLGETLKYFYLLFEDDDNVLPLDKVGLQLACVGPCIPVLSPHACCQHPKRTTHAC